jgi:H+/Cl- antiporter ClcA
MSLSKVLSYFAIVLAAIGTALSVSFLIGLGTVLFEVFAKVSAYSWWAPLIWTPTVTVCIVYLITRYVPGAAGTGSPHAIIGTDPRLHKNERSLFLSVKLAISKIFLTAGAFFAGLSLGNEGPAVQIGAALMHSIRKVTKHAKEITIESLIMLGNGIGLAVCFGSVLGGIFYCIERMNRTFFESNKFLVMLGVLSATVVCLYFFGTTPHYGLISFDPITVELLFPVVLLLVLSLIASTVWIKALIYGVNGATRFGKIKSRYPLIVAGVCGFLVALIGVLSQGSITGASELYTHQLFDTNAEYLSWFAPAKLISSILTAWSGVSAGMFIPMLNIGGGIGAFVAKSLSMGYVSILVTLGMAVFLASVSRAPLTATIIVADVSGAWPLIVLILLVSVVASKLSSMVCPDLWDTQIDMMLNKIIKERKVQ